MAVLVSERVGDLTYEGHRLEYTDFGAGDEPVVLLHGQLMSRRMHHPLARRIAASGHRVVTLDLLGHGRSDRPHDPATYAIGAYAAQVLALLDHLGAEQAVVGGTSLGANTALEVACAAPGRVRGLLLEMPVLVQTVEVGILVAAPLLAAARLAPWTVTVTGAASRAVPRSAVPFWAGIALDTLDQEPAAMAAVVQGMFLGRIAPPRAERLRTQTPALVVGHPDDPIHPAADAATLADELPRGRFVPARSVLEWRLQPDRLDAEAVAFVRRCWRAQPARPSRAARPGTMRG